MVRIHSNYSTNGNNIQKETNHTNKQTSGSHQHDPLRIYEDSLEPPRLSKKKNPILETLFPPIIHNGDITISSQHDMEVFQREGTSCIHGNLYIHGDSITNLQGLKTLQEVKGRVVITWSPNLQSLQGLNLLRKVKELNISHVNITSLEGLDSLRIVDRFAMEYCPLSTFNGIRNLQNVRSARFQCLSELQDISALKTVLFMPSLSFLFCDKLNNLHGLENRTDLVDVMLHHLAALPSLTYLSGLREIHDLTISLCSSLPSLAGLEHLEKAGTIKLWRNEKVLNLSPLQNLHHAHKLDILESPAITNLHDCSNLTELQYLHVDHKRIKIHRVPYKTTWK